MLQEIKSQISATISGWHWPFSSSTRIGFDYTWLSWPLRSSGCLWTLPKPQDLELHPPFALALVVLVLLQHLSPNRSEEACEEWGAGTPEIVVSFWLSFNRDPYIIHPNIACKLWCPFILLLKKQHVSNGCNMYLLRSPVQSNLKRVLYPPKSHAGQPADCAMCAHARAETTGITGRRGGKSLQSYKQQTAETRQILQDCETARD